MYKLCTLELQKWIKLYKVYLTCIYNRPGGVDLKISYTGGKPMIIRIFFFVLCILLFCFIGLIFYGDLLKNNRKRSKGDRKAVNKNKGSITPKNAKKGL